MNNEKGQILLLVIIVTAAILFSVLLLIGGAELYYQNVSHSLDSEKALNIAEAGVDLAIASINKGDYSGGETNFGEGVFSVSVSNKDANTKIIESVGYIPNKDQMRTKKTVKILSLRGINLNFPYALQTDQGGVIVSSGAKVLGGIYSNSNVSLSNNTITGNIWVSGGQATEAEEQSDCSSSCSDFLFGKNVNGDKRTDVAQKFKAGSTGVLSKVSVKLKKFGSPPDLMVRVLKDAGGVPDKNAVLATGILSSNLATSDYNFINVSLNFSPTLSNDSSYWLMLAASGDDSNYWFWQEDLSGGYLRGNAAWSNDWTANSWSDLSSDFSFKAFMGGSSSFVKGVDGVTIKGNVYADTVEHLAITGDAYYKVIKDSSVMGSSHPDSADPPSKNFIVSGDNINTWKSGAEALGVHSGDVTSCQNLIGKIIGDVSFEDNCDVTITSPLWITGTLILGNGNKLTLVNEGSGVIIVDGKIGLINNNKFQASDTNFLMLLSTNSSKDSENPAIYFAGNGNNASILVAQDGLIDSGSQNSFKQISGWGVLLKDNSSINYSEALSSTLFAGSSGSPYSLIKGTYQVK